MKTFLNHRQNITDNLRKYIEYEEERMIDLRKTTGYEEEMEVLTERIVKLRNLIEETESNITRDASTPIDDIVNNPVYTYVIIRDFLCNYRHWLNNQTSYTGRLHSFWDKAEFEAPTDLDLTETILAIIRIQYTYNISVQTITNGKYMGSNSPVLDKADIFDIAKKMHMYGYPQTALLWYLNALGELNEKIVDLPFDWSVALTRAIHIAKYMEKSELFDELLELGIKLDPGHKHTFYKLDIQSRMDTFHPREWDNLVPKPDWWKNYTILCNQEQKVNKLKRYHVCRYRDINHQVTYYKYKEEILHYAPFISLIYDVINDNDTNTLKERNASDLGLKFEFDEAGNSRHRPGSYGASVDLYDTEGPEISTISQKLGRVIGHNTQYYYPDRGFRLPSAGPFKVVDYGIGGYYDVHVDFFTSPTSTYLMKYSGDRMATMLLFLSDVEHGGHEIFTRLGISVKPIKNAALFWYNYTPSGYKDYRTVKMTCPVIIGQKWEARKSIWVHGNENNRPCGRSMKSTQFAVEKCLRNRVKH
ncbi:hypothetical protein SNE40_006854 [Patella caerulea]|uniref:Prolyl 4-hydroxylase alpha subunit domain-containing protein n=1 Tax=Patella caerulea TaxID=87958 RepID=A0AAN8JWJ1_PATCE